MRELAVRGVDLTPLPSQGEDRLDLLRAQRVHRRAARRGVRQRAGAGALLPVARAPLRQPEDPARLAKAPTRPGRLSDQLQQPRLDRRLNAGWDAAYQPERVFPRNATNSIACSLTVSSNRAISARAANNSRSTTPRAPPPDRELANAVNAPSRPTRRIRMIVVGSTPQRSAACRCVSSLVNNCNQICSFSSALSGRLRRPPRRLASCSSDMLLLAPS